MPAAAQRGCELIHHAHMHTRGRLLGTLARERGLLTVQLWAKPHGDRHQQGGRRAETGPWRDVGLDPHHLGLHAELDANRAQVLEPAIDLAIDRPRLRFAPADPCVPIDGGRQHYATEIVDVLTDEVHAAGRAALPTAGTLAPRLHAAPRPCPQRGHRR